VVRSLLNSAPFSLEPGDREELILRAAKPGWFELPEAFVREGAAGCALEDAEGRPVDASFDPARSALLLPGWRRFFNETSAAVWLEWLGPGRFRVLVENLPRSDETPADGSPQRIEFVAADLEILRSGALEPASSIEFDLALEAAQLSIQSGFDRLLCLPMLRDMQILDHQTRTARTVLRRLRGRALLCDEVGLGKTMEAGIILSELALRGLARSILILVPPSLIEQWQGEMRRKFSLELTSHDDPLFRERGLDAWKDVDRIIASFHTAKREPHRSAILARRWDAVVIDEAHHFRNRSTRLWSLGSEIQREFLLLLTATPVQNDLEELFNLVTLLEPGLLSTAHGFQKRFVDRKDRLTPRNLDELHRLLGEVMVRNRRSTTGLQFTRRWARTFCVTPGDRERALYDAAATLVRRRLGALREGKAGVARMGCIQLQMALGSSSHAAAGILETLSANEAVPEAERRDLESLAAAAREVTESAKADRLLGLLDEIEDKVVIFTQFRATQAMLRRRLGEAGHDVAVFHGSLTRLEKESAIRSFQERARILLATESGSEGRNLQFAHNICNFDLPWNPMRIEQRIGRLSRIGQSHDVHVFNFVASGTLEAAVLHLLEAKLNMFELVIGEIDMVLGNLDDDQEFEEVIADAWGASSGIDDFARRMEALGDRLQKAKEAYIRQRGHDEALFKDRFAPEG